MATFQPIFRSPIDSGTGALQNHQVSLTDLTGLPIILVQGQADELLRDLFPALPAKVGEVVDLGEGLLARLTPQELYLFGKTGTASLPSADLERRLAEAGQFVHATDYTHSQAVLKLAGPAAPQLLSKVCGLDFRERAFPNRQAKQTSVAKIKALIVRDDEGGLPAYFLHVTRPMGQYFWETLQDAGQEFGS